MRLISFLRPRRPSGRRHSASRRPILEPLEGRTVLSQVSLSVTSLADSGPGTLRAAILTADAGSPKDRFTIGFAETGTIDLQSPLPDLNNTIAVQGPGATSLTIEPAAGTTFSSAILTVDAGQTASLSGLTVANGSAGGIASNGTLTVANSAILNNLNNRWGGGIFNGRSGALTVTGSVIAGNTAAGGGGIYDDAGSLSISGSIISGNTAQSPGGYGGGGIWMDDGGALSITGSSISNNTASGPGGGIKGDFTSNSTISGSSINGNTATPAGGGIYLGGNLYTLTVSGCTLSGNSVTAMGLGTVFLIPGGGGGIYSEGYLTVSGCTLTGNSATGVDYGGTHYASEGGGIYNHGWAATVRDSTFGGSSAALANSADLGGAIYNYRFDSLDVRGSTFTGNTASESGGALYNLGTATVQGSTLSVNTAGSTGGGIYNGTGAVLTLDDSAVTGDIAPIGADLDDLGTTTINDSTVGVIGH
jgi:predicted outer membrane repeat protein